MFTTEENVSSDSTFLLREVICSENEICIHRLVFHHFPTTPILNNFLEKLQGLPLG